MEIKEWEKEKAEGIEQNIEDEEISGELLNKTTDVPEIETEEIEIPSVAIQVIRY